jgi:hypothetical protein
MYASHKVSVNLRRFYFPSKAQFERMHILQFGTKTSTKNCEPKLSHFHQNPWSNITKESHYFNKIPTCGTQK